MNIQFRLAKDDDVPDMAKIHTRSVEACSKNIYPPGYLDKKADIQEVFKRIIIEQKIITYIIENDLKPIGLLLFSPPNDNDLDDTFYELIGLFIHPDYFRMGIGTLSMDFFIKKVHELGKKSAVVWVIDGNTNAMNFYKKCGFTADGKIKTHNADGKPINSIRMITQV
jgi:Acetyltransferases